MNQSCFPSSLITGAWCFLNSVAHAWLEQNSQLLTNNADLCILLGTLLTIHGVYEEALKVLLSCTKDIECAALQLQIFCLMNRPDLASDLVEYTKSWAGDPILVQMMDALAGLARGDAIKYEEAFYLYEELAATHPSSSKLLASKAVCLMHAKKFQEAEQVLLESLNKVRLLLLLHMMKLLFLLFNHYYIESKRC